MLEKNGPADGRIGVIHAQLSIYFADRIPEQHLRRRKSRVKINGFVSFDFRHRRRQTVNMAATDIAAAHKIFLLLLAPTKWIYTKFGIDSKEHHLIRLSHALCR